MSIVGAFGRSFIVFGLAVLLHGGCTGEPASDAESVAGAAETDGSVEPGASEPAASPAETPRAASEPVPPRPAPEPARAPEVVEVEVPAGTILELELLTPLDSSIQRVHDEIQARTLSPLYVKGEDVLAAGSYVEGRVTEVQASGRVKGRARLAFTFDRLSTTTGVRDIRTSFFEREAEGGEKKDATIIGGAAGVGAIVGGLIGGKKGAAIGATVGGAGGTGVVLTTRGEEIRLPVGTEIHVRLDEPIVVPVN